MAVHSFDDLKTHVGHKIVIVEYGKRVYNHLNEEMDFYPTNVSCECETCNEVILSYDEGESDFDEEE